MELLFESRNTIKATSGKIYFEQCRPELQREPVLSPSTLVDGGGASIYGTVLEDGGIYRMWYQAWPRDWDGRDVALVAYAESDDGLAWSKPSLGLFDYGGTDNNLCSLGFHSPSVFIDPHASASHRYRATGYARPRSLGVPPRVTQPGYYTSHSADGLHWELDSDLPRWPYGDVITSMYHPAQDRAIVCLKRNPRIGGIPRRSVWNAEFIDCEWTDSRSALLPDEFDDVSAITRGFASGDYYGMGMMSAGSGTVGFLWQFRHTLPRTAEQGSGVFGNVDVSLAYQEGRGDRWLHAPGRKDFIAHGDTDWASGCLYTSSSAITVGDEQRLYYCGGPFTHAWYLDDHWKLQENRRQQLIAEGFYHIGLARWKRDRIFAFRSDPEGSIDLDLVAPVDRPRLLLNYRADPTGSIRVELSGREGFSGETCARLEGDDLSREVRWNTGAALPVAKGERVQVRLLLDRARVYAYDLVGS